jgi:drug/metabolite transporter (DMT)-like permease
MNRRHKAILALLCCSLLWSTGGILIKSINLHPLAISGGRSLFALLFTLLFTGKPKWSRQPAFIGAILAYACTLTLFTAATSLTTAANAILLQYSAPVFVCLFEWLFYRRKPSWLDIGAILLVLGGMSLFFMDSLAVKAAVADAGPYATLGNILALLSGISFGLLAVLMRQVRLRDHSPESVLVWGNLACVLTSLPFLFQKVPSMSDLLFLLILGTAQIGLAYLLYAFALNQMSSLELILIPVVEPLLNPVWVFLFRGEIPGLSAILGGAVVLVVVTLWCVWRERQQRKVPAQ